MHITAVYTHDVLLLDGRYEGPGWYAEVRDGQGKLVHVTRLVKSKMRAEVLAKEWAEEYAENPLACC